MSVAVEDEKILIIKNYDATPTVVRLTAEDISGTGSSWVPQFASSCATFGKYALLAEETYRGSRPYSVVRVDINSGEVETGPLSSGSIYTITQGGEYAYLCGERTGKVSAYT